MTDDILRNASCPICSEILQPPIRILPCGHSFCEECLKKINVSTERPINDRNIAIETRSCPLCCATFSGNIESLTRNRDLEKMIEAAVNEELERESKRREEEEKKKRMEEEERPQKKKVEEEEKRMKAMEEQERRDCELAVRLVQDNQAELVEDLPVSAGVLYQQEGVLTAAQGSSDKKHDLSKWKYTELRDALNTSKDIELLAECREEFHRRLKVYHMWKAKNKARNQTQEQRAPKAVTDHASSHQAVQAPAPAPVKPAASPQTPRPADNAAGQRYFRIPFIRNAEQNLNPQFQKKGWLYMHFDGQYIARQLELHPEKLPLLLVAGKDDMRICELSLDDTGLARKKGAEILPREFEQVWNSNQGHEYMLAAINAKQARPTYATAMMQQKR